MFAANFTRNWFKRCSGRTILFKHYIIELYDVLYLFYLQEMLSLKFFSSRNNFDGKDLTPKNWWEGFDTQEFVLKKFHKNSYDIFTR